MKRLVMIAAAVAVLAVGVLAIGGAAADENDGFVGSFLAKVADKLGVGEDELKTAIDEAGTETLDEGVAQGLLTDEQAERLQEGGFPFRMGPRHGPGHVMEAAVEVLDMPRDELMEQLRDGASLAQVAEAKGMSVEDFKTAFLDQAKTQLDELVAEDDLTQEQADGIFQHTEENIDDIVSGEGCLGGFGDMRHGPGDFGGIRHGPGDFGGMRHGPGGMGGPGFGPFSDKPEAESSDVTA